MRLCADDDVGTGYVVARALVEQAVTFAYLIVCSDDEFARWGQHGLQKGYRLLDRSKQVGDVAVRMSAVNVPLPEEIPGMAESLANFTGQRGGERTRWSDVSLDDRIAVIQREIPEPLATTMLLNGLVNCYEIGAEVQHATFIGATVQHLDNLGSRESHIGVIMMSACGCVTAAGIAVGTKLGDDESIAALKKLLGEGAREVAAARAAEREAKADEGP